MTFKAAVIQAGAVPFDIEASLAKAEVLIAEAGAQGCRLAVFPRSLYFRLPQGAEL